MTDPSSAAPTRTSLGIRLRRRVYRGLSKIERLLQGPNPPEYWIPRGDIPVLDLAENGQPGMGSPDLAIHLHAYYPELVPELLGYVSNIGRPVSLYVTTDTDDKARQLESTLAGLEGMARSEIIITPNRGRDIGPWLVGTAEFQQRHDLWCHVHTKKSLHEPAVGDGWRRFLMEQLMGETTAPRIPGAFHSEPGLGLVIPPFYVYALVRGNNDFDNPARAARFFDSLGIASPPPKHPVFSAGSMCWYRPQALAPLFEHGFGWDDFEDEAGQIEMTLMHLVERSLVYVAGQAGFDYRMIRPSRP